ncbi:unnamed protein product [Caenorhabditis angaria]|uniref:DUF19 domain-containing protein n=1 Tax=Caenorhabditis angaria TaxID=860376 RepID=A0A9P1NA36_9PELO|nr:unnamed protein product [Caenorhabditis angaria]
MKILTLSFLFLFFSPGFVFSTETGSILDYEGDHQQENPIECLLKTQRNSSIIYTEKEIEELNVVHEKLVEDCVNKISKTNSKVHGFEKEITQKIVQAMELDIRVNNCHITLLLENAEEVKSCEKSMRLSESFCDSWWGKNGCVISLREKYCGLELTVERRDVLGFILKRQKECIDLYYNKN